MPYASIYLFFTKIPMLLCIPQLNITMPNLSTNFMQIERSQSSSLRHQNPTSPFLVIFTYLQKKLSFSSRGSRSCH